MENSANTLGLRELLALIEEVKDAKTRDDRSRKLEELKEALEQAFRQDAKLAQNEKLVKALQEAKEEIAALGEEVEKLSAPPSPYGTFDSANDDGTVNVLTRSGKVKVNLHPQIKPESLKRGQELVLNAGMNVIEPKGFETKGDVVTFKANLDDGRVVIITRLDEEVVADKAFPLMEITLKEGDKLRYDGVTRMVYEKLPKAEVEDLALEEAPNVSYEDIGGLKLEIETIHENIEIPFTPKGREWYKRMKLTASKGALLYGPPGCGKTMIAKAIANGLAKRVSAEFNRPIKGYFFNIKGPEILNKYLGESERKIREIFKKALEKASENCPVIIFFDEADSLLRVRGSGTSSDIEITTVPQFLAEIDGVETIENVIVILASNRHDLIDPAVLRPGRIDIKLKIERPDKEGTREIFNLYLTPDISIHAKYFDEKHPNFNEAYRAFEGDRKRVMNYMVDEVTKRLWATKQEPYQYKGLDGNLISVDNSILEFTTAQGDTTFYLKDMVSGAMIKSIADRGKRNAIKRAMAGGEEGIMTLDLCLAVEFEKKENEELPNTEDDVNRWLAIQGRKERVLRVRPRRKENEKQEEKEVVKTGQYL
ncbi:MAG: proteasome ATPase [Candidatus Sungbacteria bacterium RIFCSPLOWO2_01_FULL_47_10]|uniref:Proteasome ATPase n=1 Tax=Candidatus Sungbacteria bacterium RIFCSPLOWO2_01_FULL_47_10 TaxID=1802276 RepID=A0A1G2L317_9BACT|nr:MAG: proteasome ATPase [Candidatus Sungbacteria bacterium RIFCSPLOWO2_01_FULL_47_10]